MRKLDLQPPFLRLRPLAEDFEDQPGAVEHLCGPGLFEIALLHGAERMIDDDQLGIVYSRQCRDLFDLAGTEQRSGRGFSERHDLRGGDIELDGFRQRHSLGEARFA